MLALIISKQIKWISYRLSSLNLWLDQMPVTLIGVRRTIQGLNDRECLRDEALFQWIVYVYFEYIIVNRIDGLETH
jgi:hypothetical protein